MRASAFCFVHPSTLRLVLVLGAISQAAYGQRPPGLRIAVLAGEDAVNVIAQRSAVAPVVEVRDRKNQPIVGALVRFSIRGGQHATFAGARSVMVITNAAGRAAVESITPTTSGIIHIDVAAVFQGETATASIAQTNVITTAQASAASAARAGNSGGVGSTLGTAAGIGGGAIADGVLLSRWPSKAG